MARSRIARIESRRRRLRWLAESLGSDLVLQRYLVLSDRVEALYRAEAEALFRRYGLRGGHLAHRPAEAAEQIAAAARARDEAPVSYLVFIRSGWSGLIRIDEVDSVREALAILEALTGEPMTLLGFQLNTERIDVKLRRRLSRFQRQHPRHSGDDRWFEAAGPVLAAVEEFRVRLELVT